MNSRDIGTTVAVANAVLNAFGANKVQRWCVNVRAIIKHLQRAATICCGCETTNKGDAVNRSHSQHIEWIRIGVVIQRVTRHRCIQLCDDAVIICIRCVVGSDIRVWLHCQGDCGVIHSTIRICHAIVKCIHTYEACWRRIGERTIWLDNRCSTLCSGKSHRSSRRSTSRRVYNRNDITIRVTIITSKRRAYRLIGKHLETVITGNRRCIQRTGGGIFHINYQFTGSTVTVLVTNFQLNSIFACKIYGRRVGVTAVRADQQLATHCCHHHSRAGNRVTAAISYNQVIIRFAKVIDKHVTVYRRVDLSQVNIIFRLGNQIKHTQVQGGCISSAVAIIDCILKCLGANKIITRGIYKGSVGKYFNCATTCCGYSDTNSSQYRCSINRAYR